MMEDSNGMDRKGKHMAGIDVCQAKGSLSLRPLGPHVIHIPVPTA